ncbi:protein-export chaperone SecB [Aliidiomarina celeris]|uniref:protein-export chaperone SecB n=1 Tax=Aliidiomarina celeris TaxID=2249428 RepID=UPI000DE89F69|nr:protein-export chaperone SecB [Aliidiomarina celeris]
MADEQQNAGANAQQQAEPQFAIQRIYVKDISFEAPNSPAIFRKEWSPNVSVDMNVSNSKLEENLHEVVLTLTVKNTIGEETAFLCEIAQAGIFAIGSQVPEEQLPGLLAAFCPNILFPYAREAIASLVNRGTFPQLNLAPVNFDAVFAQHIQQQQAAQGQKLDA